MTRTRKTSLCFEVTVPKFLHVCATGHLATLVRRGFSFSRPFHGGPSIPKIPRNNWDSRKTVVNSKKRKKKESRSFDCCMMTCGAFVQKDGLELLNTALGFAGENFSSDGHESARITIACRVRYIGLTAPYRLRTTLDSSPPYSGWIGVASNRATYFIGFRTYLTDLWDTGMALFTEFTAFVVTAS